MENYISIKNKKTKRTYFYTKFEWYSAWIAVFLLGLLSGLLF